MRLKTVLHLAICFLGSSFFALQAQVLTVDPIFPHQNDTVTITFDATEGNGALANIVPVYAHTGVITNLSSNANDWRNVQGNWGTADSRVLMTPLGNNLHRISYHIPTFYNLGGTDSVYRLAFVFRNTNGSIVGREFDGSDIFYPVYPSNQLFARFVQPAGPTLILDAGDSIQLHAAASDTALLTITDNGAPVASITAKEYMQMLQVTGSGLHELILTATANGQTAADTFHYVINPNLSPQDPPAGTELGINYTSNTSVRLLLHAPGKSSVYVIGSFNNYQPDPAYAMRRNADGTQWWIDITGLTAGQDYTYQYLVDGQLRVADPYSTLVLDPWNDSFISNTTYPNMPSYPAGLTSGHVTVLSPGQAPYNWQVTNFVAPAEDELVVYELLIRDFIARHDYATLIDTLDYLEKLGINAIELMPVHEFEGNESWGYNPSFHMALDKYYGPAADFKAFIDECHSRGIAVILDVVFNHAFSQSPFCQLYWNSGASKPSIDNPWLNPDARHPFNVGYDFNHEAQPTKEFVYRNLKYWIEEYHVDGYRFDLSKGLTQTNSGSDVGFWGQYDASRIAILKDYADTTWAANPNAYVILEHFADNSEETALANLGMMLWGNHNYNYAEATMGYVSTSNFEWIDYQRRGWSQPKVMGYMESHDEERLMFKNLEFGNGSGSYDITQLSTALDRLELAGCLFFTIPGPKMTLMMSELGYDHSTFDPCNICNKPIKWEYNTEADRIHLYKVWAALSWLKRDHAAFSSTNYQLNASGMIKTLQLNDASMNVSIAGNFGVGSTNASIGFQHTGTWYEYFTGDSITVTGSTFSLNMTPGEYKLYTDVRLPLPDLSVPLAADEAANQLPFQAQAWPNPAAHQMQIRYELPRTAHTSLQLFDLQGRLISTLSEGPQAKGQHQIQLDAQALQLNGHYLLRIQSGSTMATLPLIFLD